MLVYILTLYLLSVVRQHNVNCVSICSNNNATSRRIYVVGKNIDIGPCGCNITVKKTDGQDVYQTSVIIKRRSLSGDCGCKLVRNSTTTNCPLDSDNFTMQLTSNIKLHMENKVVSSGDVCFNFSVTSSPGSVVVLSCQNQNKNTEAKPQSTTKNSVVSQNFTNFSSSTITTIVGNGKTDNGNIENNNPGNDDASLLPIILGCSVGGTVIIILILIIGGCVLLRRRNQKTENPKRAEMIVTDNDLYVSSDSIPNNNNERGSTMQAEIEIIPNDLYCSSDSLDIDLNDTKQPEPVPNTNNEYAVVMKKPNNAPRLDKEIELKHKPNTVNSNNENIPKDKLSIKQEINRIVGPKGDDYTLVTRD